MDSIDRKMLGLLQTEFPLTPEPYSTLGSRLDIMEEEVILRIKQLKSKGIVRQISPVIDARRLGYHTTLVAMRIAENKLEKAAQVIGEHSEISHGYERDHHFNLWFTLSMPETATTEMVLSQLTTAIGAEAYFDLPATRLFKIGAYFGVDEESEPTGIETSTGGRLPQTVSLSPEDVLVINEVQQDLPLISRPFVEMAMRAGMSELTFLMQCRSLLQRHVMRRFGAAVNHRKAGFKANAMTCWKVIPEKVETVARALISLPQVSHCYERKPNPLWPYNLFAMIHGHTREACQDIAKKVSDEHNLTDCVLLFSTREFKKTRVKYLARNQ